MSNKREEETEKAREAAVSELIGEPEARAEEFAANLQGEIADITKQIAKKPVKKLDEPTVVEGTIDPRDLDNLMRRKAMETDGASAEELAKAAKEVIEERD